MIRRAVAPAALAVTLCACGSVDPEPLPPSPSMIAFSGDPFVERGIRPDPEALDAGSPESGAILVEWRQLPASTVNIGGYHLYRASESDDDGRPTSFTRIASISETPVGNDTSHSDSLVDPNVRYWYCVRAYTRSTGAEGPPSDTVAFTLTHRPIPVSPSGELDSAEMRPLVFRYGPPLLGGHVAIHLYRVHPQNQRIVLDTVWRQKAYATFNDPSVTYSGPALTPGSYKWRVDKIFENQPTGNASSWITFVAP